MSSTEKSLKRKSMFIEGPVAPSFIADSIAKHSGNHAIGAHEIFLGQIREDEADGRKVTGIDFSAYAIMADEAYTSFREELFSRHALTCMHVHHSLGPVRVGEINLFVFVSSRHRKDAMAACRELVEWIK
ncbi:MAG: molybdenum cofactor biosynthesis protein MoaE [Bacteroidota bacterium]